MNTQLSLEFRLRRHVVPVEDFVFAIGDSRDGKNQPLLVREVLFFKTDSRLDVDVLEVLEQLLDQDKLAGWSGADTEDYLLLL